MFVCVCVGYIFRIPFNLNYKLNIKFTDSANIVNKKKKQKTDVF